MIASQALITGVYSLTNQATMLGFMPRVSVQHTSSQERGQIYVPAMNWLLMLSTIARPPLSTITDSFTNIWNTPEGGKPASWTGRAEDLRIQRLELGKSFYKLYLLNLDPTNSASYTFEITAPSSVSPAGGQLTAVPLMTY